jgi:N-acetylglucosaminyldiphosphoundecaprenol N-acetyl-beta-D-mannosaminyltransferase
MPDLPPRLDVLGARISATTLEELVAFVVDAARADPAEPARLVLFCNVHSVMTARRLTALRDVIDGADVAAPDGMPLVWALRTLHGRRLPGRATGPDAMLAVLEGGRAAGLRHYLLGGSTQSLDALVHRLHERLGAGLLIAGTEAPPVAPVEAFDVPGIAARVRQSRARVLWVGLGMPKQELLMARLAPELPGVVLLGVGAAFDFHAGVVRQAPRWMRERGLEWVHRLGQEPRRLLPRYLGNNPAFLALFGGAWLRSRVGRRGRPEPGP